MTTLEPTAIELVLMLAISFTVKLAVVNLAVAFVNVS